MSLLSSFRRRFSPADDGGYKVFTDRFDQIVLARDLKFELEGGVSGRHPKFNQARRAFFDDMAGVRARLAEAGRSFSRDMDRLVADDVKRHTVVSFLIDHSGSMRGPRMLCALMAVEVANHAVGELGLPTEILGFTTVSWKGGLSRQEWQKAGQPKNPGRLCDLRHIIYKSVEDREVDLTPALHPELLRENVDGEALLWAASRLRSRRWKRRVICVLSDGAPVDDSSLASNEDNRLLWDHLKHVEDRLSGEGFFIGFLQLEDDANRTSKVFRRATSPESAGRELLDLMRAALTQTSAAGTQ